MKSIFVLCLLFSSLSKADILSQEVHGRVHFWSKEPIERCYESCEWGYINEYGIVYQLKEDRRLVEPGQAIYELTSTEFTIPRKNIGPVRDVTLKIKIEVPLDLLGSPIYWKRNSSSDISYVDVRITVGSNPVIAETCQRNTYFTESLKCLLNINEQLVELDLARK